jgi:hypothetical protein
MNHPLDFTTTLRAFIEQARRRTSDLEHLTGISARTIENWCAGVVRRPREVTDVLKLAHALALNITETNTLLNAAGQLPLESLWTQARQADDITRLNLLKPWASEMAISNPHPENTNIKQETSTYYLFGIPIFSVTKITKILTIITKTLIITFIFISIALLLLSSRRGGSASPQPDPREGSPASPQPGPLIIPITECLLNLSGSFMMREQPDISSTGKHIIRGTKDKYTILDYRYVISGAYKQLWLLIQENGNRGWVQYDPSRIIECPYGW